ncbi:DUF4336 domain-containing protein [Cucumibacter marinus]|uniref:DUF4336 domain-containing protein n=1 Tax=Cucumibacter marinus TaxID=1121252 RepID=UPI000407CBBD|nr:DUF4336 domain-containing protein [Cucumibacter marinus]
MEDPLIAFGEDIWLAEGPVIKAALGFRYPTRMAVIRLSGGRLVVWSPVALTPSLSAAVMGLGQVAWLVAPNSLHHLSIGDWKAAYPNAKIVAVPGLAKKRPDLTIDVELGAQPLDEWSGEIDHVLFHNALATEAVFLHRKSATVLVTDLIQHLPKGWFGGWRAIIANLDLMTAKEPEVPRKFRTGFRDKAKARANAQQVLDWPSEKLVMAHGEPVVENAQTALRHAFGWLMR